jgi:hypothetical protein
MELKMSRKKVKKQQNKELVPVDAAQEMVNTLVTARNWDNQVKFSIYRLFGLPVREAAKLTGFSDKYGYKVNSMLKNDDKLKSRVERILSDFPDKYRLVCKARLPWLSEIEGKALAEYDEDPKLMIQKPQLAKQIKQAAGALPQDIPPVQPTININELKMIVGMNIPDSDE